MDLSQFTDAELEAVKKGDFSGLTDEKFNYLKELIRSSQPKTRTTAEEAGRQVGLTARAGGPALAGAMLGMPGGLPGMALGALGATFAPTVIDPFINLSNKYLGTNITPTGQAMEQLMTMAGLPEPETQQERIVQAGARGIAGAGGFAKGVQQLAATAPVGSTQANVFQQLAQYPVQQISAGGLASGASQAGYEKGVGQMGQMGLAFGAGMIAPGGPKLPVTARAGQAVKSVVSPLTQTGREVIIGNVLNRLANDPDAARRALEASRPLVPGVAPTTAAVARDVGLAGAETGVRGLDPTNMFGLRLSQNQQALLDAFRRVSGKPGSIQAAEAKRADVTGPLREAAFKNAQPVGVAPVFQHISGVLADPNKQRTVVQQAMDEVQRLVYSKVDPETGFADPRALYSVRKDIGDMMSGKYGKDQANFSQARGELADVSKQLDKIIEAGAPGFQKYMEKYAKISKGIDQMRLLQGMESKVTTGQPNIMTGEPVLGASALRRQLAQKADDVAQLPTAARIRVESIIDEINRGQAATAPGVKPPGSDTFKNLSVGNLIGKIMGQGLADNKTMRTIARPLDWLYKLPDEAMQSLLVEAMLDPQLAAGMMNKANLMTVDKLGKSLQDKAIQLGYGTYLGAQEGMR